jgi:hypothetical protein
MISTDSPSPLKRPVFILSIKKEAQEEVFDMAKIAKIIYSS